MSNSMYLEKLFSLEGKVSLISGGHQGLGLEMALALASVGSDIVVFDKKPLSSSIVDDIKSLGKKCLYCKVDVSEEEMVKEAYKECLKCFGGIDILVNNAGISELTHINEDLNIWRRIMETNLFGTYILTKHTVSHMISKNIHGSIINIASINGCRPVEAGSSYCTSKAGVIHLTKSLVSELIRYHIRINAVAPGYMLTERIKRRIISYRSQLEQVIPMKRLGDVSEIVGVVLFLASNQASSYVTGSVISVDGGLNACEISI